MIQCHLGIINKGESHVHRRRVTRTHPDRGLDFLLYAESLTPLGIEFEQFLLGFVFSEKGLIGDLSLEGTKVTKIKTTD